MAKKSLRKEILRKLFHLMELPILLVYTIVRYSFSERLAILALTVIFLVLIEVEYIRLEYKVKLPASLDILRKKERNNVIGSIFFVSATIIVFAAFDYPIAILALLLTVFGDLTSALIGIKFGKHKLHKQKTAEGFLAGLAANFLVGYLFLPAYPAIFLSMAFVASIVELFTGKMDDNLTVPLFAAFTGQILVFVLNLPLQSFPGPLMSSLLHVLIPT